MVEGYNPSMQARPAQRQQGGFASSLAAILGLSAVGAGTGAAFGYFAPIKEDLFVRQHIKEGLKTDYDEALKALETQKTSVSDALKTLADDDPQKALKTKELARLEKQYELFKKQGLNGYAEKIINRVKDKPAVYTDASLKATETRITAKISDLTTKISEAQGKGVDTADLTRQLDIANANLADVKKLTAGDVRVEYKGAANKGIADLRSKLLDLTEKGKALFKSKGADEAGKTAFGNIVKNAKLAKTIEYAKKGGMYTAIGVGILMILKGIFGGKSRQQT